MRPNILKISSNLSVCVDISEIFKSSFSVNTFTFSEKCYHNRKINGYEIFGHSCDKDAIPENTDNHSKTVKIVEGTRRVTECNESEFQKICQVNYENYFQIAKLKSMKMVKNIISSKKAENKKLIKTMKDWCENKASTNAKAFVHSGSSITDIYKNLYYGKFGKLEEQRDDLGQKFNIEEFPSKDTIIVYNPGEKTILLIREAKDEDVQNELKLCVVELKMLVMLLRNELKQSGIKLIPLVVTDKEVKCKACLNHLILRKEIEQIKSFHKWWEKKSAYYGITISDFFESGNESNALDEGTARKILAKLVSCVSLKKVEDIFPTQNADDKMKGALLLLTPEQIDILSSEDKHIIIDGPYGSGKSIIARIKGQMLAESLSEDELLYYVSYDPKSELLHELPGRNNKLQKYPDKDEKKGMILSDMVIDILTINEQHDENEDKQLKKINLIIDEYDGEKLDEEEAKKFNEIIYDKYAKVFEDAVIMLVAQSMKKERKKSNIPVDSNRFDLLAEKMKRKELTLGMRNSVEIFNLLQATQEFLKDKKTSYQLPEEKNDEQQKNTENDTDTKEKSITEKQLVNPGSSTPHDPGTSSKSSRAPEKSGQDGFEVDEVINHLKLHPAAETDDGITLESTFKYGRAKDIGHKISCKLPKMFELSHYEDEFQKTLALAVIFETLNIAESNANNKHVILHFKESNKIPERAFNLLAKQCMKQNCLEVNAKITYAYKEFKDDNLSKYIFVGNFRKFRGLEHSKVTVIIDSGIAALQHYLVECIARCTTQLNIVLLGNNEILTNMTNEWKKRQGIKALVRQWEIKIDEDEKHQEEELFDTREEGVIRIFKSSNCYKEMKQLFEELSGEEVEEPNSGQSLKEKRQR